MRIITKDFFSMLQYLSLSKIINEREKAKFMRDFMEELDSKNPEKTKDNLIWIAKKDNSIFDIAMKLLNQIKEIGGNKEC